MENIEDLKIELDPKAMVIVLSDVHLGALIVLGDCFDLIMDTHKDLLEFGLYREIFDKYHHYNFFSYLFPPFSEHFLNNILNPCLTLLLHSDRVFHFSVLKGFSRYLRCEIMF